MKVNIQKTLLNPEKTVALIGDGQLAQKIIRVLQRLGYDVIVLGTSLKNYAMRYAKHYVLVDSLYDLEGFEVVAQYAQYAILEFENVSVEGVQLLHDRGLTVSHPAEALAVASNRIQEKIILQQCGLNPVPHVLIYSDQTPESIVQLPGIDKIFPGSAILKTATGGYDGHGQIGVTSIDGLYTAFDRLGRVDCVLERRIDIQMETSCIGTIGLNGNPDDARLLPIGKNVHRHGMLFQTVHGEMLNYPDRYILCKEGSQIKDQTMQLARQLKIHRGVLAVEYFVDQDEVLYANEIATRTHNSGHFSEFACGCSQHKLAVMAVLGLITPMQSGLDWDGAIMTNVVGTDLPLGAFSEIPRLDWYGKEAKPGRKMGDFTVSCWGEYHHAAAYFNNVYRSQSS